MSAPVNLDHAILNAKRFKEEIDRRKRSIEQAEELRGSLYKFVEASWSVVEPAKPYIKSWAVEAICDHVQAAYNGQIPNLLCTVPPGSAKSMVVSVDAPAWQWTRNPGWRSTHLSYESSLSTRDSVKCRDLMDSIWYQETFKPEWKYASDQNEKTYYVNSAKGFRVSGKGTGWRSHLLCYDDPLNAEDRNSDKVLIGIVDEWENVLSNRFVDMAKAIRIVIMQRLTDRDLAGHWLRKGGVEHLKIPLEYDPARSKVTCIWEDPRGKDLNLPRIMTPELFPPQVVENLKRNSESFSGQYQQEPQVAGGGMLKSHWWKYWKPAGMKLPAVRVLLPNGKIDEREAVDLPDSFDMVLQSWDLTFGKTKGSDYVCGQVQAARGANRYILDEDMRQMGIVDTMNAIRVMTARYPKAHLKIIEKAANAQAVNEMLEGEIAGIVLVPPKGSKEACAAAVAPEVEAGNWYLPHPMIASWVGNPEKPVDGVGFLASSSLFPYGANDDDVDAFSHGGMRFQEEMVGGALGVSDSDLRVDPFEFDTKWPRLFGMAVTWKEVAAVWMCRRPETDAYYMYAEYCVPPTAVSQHAAEILKPGDWIQGVITATDVGRNEKDGYALVGKYRAMKLKIDVLQSHEESLILDLQDALKTGKLKVFSNLPRIFDQYRMYRRDEKGGLPDHNCGMIKAMMVAWAGRKKMKGPAVPPPPDRTGGYMSTSPANGWMSS